jgi:GT2 family glycosyltransferase
MAKIGIITVSYNSGKVISEFLDSIYKQSYKDYCLYIIDNNSCDNTLELVSTYKGISLNLVRNSINLGFAKAVNQGLDIAISDGCEYIMLMNNDTAFTEEFLECLLRDLIINNADMISPKVKFPLPSNKISSAGGRFVNWQGMKNENYGQNQNDKNQFNKLIRCDFVPACGLLIKSSLFELSEVGRMDEKYFIYFEDADWLLRAKRLNKVLLYTPNATLYHKESSLSGGVFSEAILPIFFKNRMYFTVKNFKGLYRLYSIIYVFMAVVLKFLTGKIPFRKYKIVFRALYHGIKT